MDDNLKQQAIMEQNSTFSTDVNTALILINQRRQIFFSNTHPYAKLIALAIAEHMTCESLSAYPSKSRLRRMCGMKADTFELYWPEAKTLFDTEDRSGKSCMFRHKVLIVAEELAILWSEKAAPKLRVVAGTEHTPPEIYPGSPPRKYTPGGNIPRGVTPSDPPGNIPPEEIYRRDNTTLRAREKVTQETPPLTSMAAGVAMSILALGAAGDPAAAKPVDPPAIVQQVSASIDLDTLMVKLEGAAGAALRSPASAPGLLVLTEPLRWLEQGCDLEKDILPTIRARSAGKRNSISTWGYFTQAIANARELRSRALPEANVSSDRRPMRPKSNYSATGEYIGRRIT